MSQVLLSIQNFRFAPPSFILMFNFLMVYQSDQQRWQRRQRRQQLLAPMSTDAAATQANCLTRLAKAGDSHKTSKRNTSMSSDQNPFCPQTVFPGNVIEEFVILQYVLSYSKVYSTASNILQQVSYTLLNVPQDYCTLQ